MHFLTLAGILFTLGVFGIFLNRKNVIIILMSIELMLLAVNINFVAFSRHTALGLDGQIASLFVIVLAAAEAAVALAIVLNFYNNHLTIDVDRAVELKG